MTPPAEPVRCLGVDLSPAHAGAVLIDNAGTPPDYRVVTPHRKAAHVYGEDRVLLLRGRVPGEDVLSFEAWRLTWWVRTLGALLDELRPSHVAVEGYAMAAKYRAHQVGEVGGLLRVVCYQRALPLRVHDPFSLKFFACGRATATSADVEAVARTAWRVNWWPSGDPPPKAAPPGEDLAVAHALARLLALELRVRAGLVSLEDLAEGARSVFLRVTKSYPTNLLARPFTGPPPAVAGSTTEAPSP